LTDGYFDIHDQEPLRYVFDRPALHQSPFKGGAILEMNQMAVVLSSYTIASRFYQTRLRRSKKGNSKPMDLNFDLIFVPTCKRFSRPWRDLRQVSAPPLADQGASLIDEETSWLHLNKLR